MPKRLTTRVPDKALYGRIQKLPQELQDQIRDYALHIEPGFVNITHTYKPPIALGLTRYTRQQTAKHYYASSIFYLQTTGFSHGHHTLYQAWANSLPTDHRDVITEIRSEAPVWLKKIQEQTQQSGMRYYTAVRRMEALWFKMLEANGGDGEKTRTLKNARSMFM